MTPGVPSRRRDRARRNVHCWTGGVSSDDEQMGNNVVNKVVLLLLNKEPPRDNHGGGRRDQISSILAFRGCAKTHLPFQPLGLRKVPRAAARSELLAVAHVEQHCTLCGVLRQSKDVIVLPSSSFIDLV